MKGFLLTLILYAVFSAFILPIASAEAPAAEQEFVAAFTPSTLVLDPLHSFKTLELQIATGIYEGLVTYHPITLRPVPGVAKRWELSEDRLIYRFYLRNNARYSNGDPVTAQDFRESWLRIVNPHDQGEYSFLFDVIKGVTEYRNGEQADPETVGIRAVSSTLLEVELARPASHFLGMLCHMCFVPVHPQYREQECWEEGSSIIGNGPFTLQRSSQGAMILEKNDAYWDSENVKLDRIRLRFMDDPAEITREFNEGRIHWSDNAEADMLDNSEAYQLSALFGTSYMFFLADSAPWSDPRIRRGLALLLPWASIREQFSFFATETLVPSLDFYPEVTGIKEGDVQEGLALLEEAGYPEGRGLPEIMIKVPRHSSAETVAGKMVSQWKEAASIEARVEVLDYDDYLSRLKEKNFTLASSTWIGDFADPLAFLQIWTSGSNLNDAYYKNPEFDALIEEAMAESNEARYKMLAEAEKLLLDEAVVLPLAHPPAFNLIDLDKIVGWHLNPLDIHPFKYIRFKRYELRPDVAWQQTGK